MAFAQTRLTESEQALEAPGLLSRFERPDSLETMTTPTFDRLSLATGRPGTEASENADVDPGTPWMADVSSLCCEVKPLYSELIRQREEHSMTPAELSDLSLRISALERVVERLATAATGSGGEALVERRLELDAVALNPETLGDLKHAANFERLLLRGVRVR